MINRTCVGGWMAPVVFAGGLFAASPERRLGGRCKEYGFGRPRGRSSTEHADANSPMQTARRRFIGQCDGTTSRRPNS